MGAELGRTVGWLGGGRDEAPGLSEAVEMGLYECRVGAVMGLQARVRLERLDWKLGWD